MADTPRQTASRSKRAVTVVAAITFTGAAVAFNVDNIRSVTFVTPGTELEGPGLTAGHTRTTAS